MSRSFGVQVAGLHASEQLSALAAMREPVRGLGCGQRRPHRVLVVSYETLHAHGRVLAASAGVDLLVCDEGHRLRNGGERVSPQ